MALSASSKSAAQRWFTKYGDAQATKSCAAGFRGKRGADRDFPAWCSEVFNKPWGTGSTSTTPASTGTAFQPATGPDTSAAAPTVSGGNVTRDGDTVQGTSSAYSPTAEAPTTGRGLIDELTGPPTSADDVTRETAPAGQTTFSAGAQKKPINGTSATPPKDGEKKSGGVPWWAWVGGGLAAVALLARKGKKKRRR